MCRAEEVGRSIFSFNNGDFMSLIAKGCVPETTTDTCTMGCFLLRITNPAGVTVKHSRVAQAMV